jgi:aryl-alcohol dehydrogenase-like predicted oxidoreductase
MGRRVEQRPELFDRAHFREWNDRSRENLGVETIDLVQLHCPPPAVYADDDVFAALDELVEEGRVRNYGVSVETVEEARAAIARPHVATVQIILNAFRLKPLERVLPDAREAGVGIIARVPLASGLLSGKYDEHTAFDADDHRNYNRHGEAFDVGETFSGVPFEAGLAAVRDLRDIVPADVAMAQFALRWIIDQPGVSVVIPGARNAEQARGNVAAATLPPLSEEQQAAVREVYERHISEHVHDRW